jgi:hypothetical protein
MPASPHTEPLRYVNEETAATSSPQGTVLPRPGIFWGVRAPRSHSAVVLGELTGTQAGETQIRSWFEPRWHLAEQTSLIFIRSGLIRLADMGIDSDAIPANMYSNQTFSQSGTGSYSRAISTDIIRDADVAYAFFPSWGDSTESPWRRLLHALAPLRSASTAVLEAIDLELEQDTVHPDQSRHAGLTAVAWLTNVLELSRPTILRMGGVPESTFYAWRKNQQSIVRTPSVSRLLRLQAQVGLLGQALGRDGLRAWLLSRDHLERLQGDDATFDQTLGEADEVLARTTQITPRRRMRLEDYEFTSEQSAGERADEFPSWPGASKLPEELAE